MLVLLALLCVSDAALSSRSLQQATSGGLEEVISLLGEMLTTFNAQQSEDTTNWNKYSTWNDGTVEDRNQFISQQRGVVTTATGQMNANKALAQTLTAQLEGLAGEIAETRSSLAELLNLRNEEHAVHEETVKDLTDTSTAVSHAIEVLEGHYGAQQAMTLGQVKQEVAKALSMVAMSRVASAKFALTQVLQGPTDWLNKAGSDYESYEGVAAESGGVVGTLQQIHGTLLANKQAAVEKESESRKQYEDAKAAKDSDLTRALAEQETKTNAKNEAVAKIGQNQATISQANQDIETAQGEIKLLEDEHAAFLSMYNDRSSKRSGEMAATQAALDALQEVTVHAARNPAFLAISNAQSVRFTSAVGRLLKLARQNHNGALLEAATLLQAKAKAPQAFFNADAMNPVKELLSKLISRLEAEASAETSHKEWCDTEKATSNAAKTHREGMIESLTAEIGALETAIQGLGEEITFLGAELVRVQQETEEATRIRNEQNAAFVKTKEDHDTVIAALEKAINALSGAYGFLQTGKKQAFLSKATVTSVERQSPSPFSSYASGNAQGGDAITMLQDLLNRYSSARTAFIKSEEKAKEAFELLVKANEEFRQETSQTKMAKETEKRNKEQRLEEARGELSMNQVELGEVTQYLMDLKPACDDIRMSFEERKQRREAEIAALKECLNVLSDPTMLR